MDGRVDGGINSLDESVGQKCWYTGLQPQASSAFNVPSFPLSQSDHPPHPTTVTPTPRIRALYTISRRRWVDTIILMLFRRGQRIRHISTTECTPTASNMKTCRCFQTQLYTTKLRGGGVLDKHCGYLGNIPRKSRPRMNVKNRIKNR